MRRKIDGMRRGFVISQAEISVRFPTGARMSAGAQLLAVCRSTTNDTPCSSGFSTTTIDFPH